MKQHPVLYLLQVSAAVVHFLWTCLHRNLRAVLLLTAIEMADTHFSLTHTHTDGSCQTLNVQIETVFARRSHNQYLVLRTGRHYFLARCICFSVRL